MAINPFLGRSREWLEEQLNLAQDDLAAGKTTASWGSGDASASKKVDYTPQQRIELLLRALNVLAPDDYPAASIKRVSRTQIRFESTEVC